ncbi:MAG: hypothetical protein AMXMBFR59_19290 [Rhodanobacteraceae bacterium]
MRRIVCSLLATAALAGCASTGYYHQEGAADYYYEPGHAHGAHYGAYSTGPGYYGFYDPYWWGAGFHFGLTSWPYSAYGYGPYYSGWPYFGYSPWYDSWWGVGYNDWSWHRHQQALVRQRIRNVDAENAAVAAMNGRRMPSGDAGTGESRRARPAPGTAGEPGPSRGFDTGRQLRTESVDPYYGTPRVRRGEAPLQREPVPSDARTMPARDRGARSSTGLPTREERPIRSGPALQERRLDTPDRRSQVPVMRQAPSAPARTFTPAPAMDRAPSFAPRVDPTPSSGSGRTRTQDK